ncbi:unknown [Prevotella sp. CAG:487]|nr:unknown [Prevotella sp. CAG:487]
MLHFYTKSNVSERNRACYDISERSLLYIKTVPASAMRACCDIDCRRMFYKKEKIKVQ